MNEVGGRQTAFTAALQNAVSLLSCSVSRNGSRGCTVDLVSHLVHSKVTCAQGLVVEDEAPSRGWKGWECVQNQERSGCSAGPGPGWHLAWDVPKLPSCPFLPGFWGAELQEGMDTLSLPLPVHPGTLGCVLPKIRHVSSCCQPTGTEQLGERLAVFVSNCGTWETKVHVSSLCLCDFQPEGTKNTQG